ncbi:hypothetical protein ACHAAC_00145 [Aeromicrobium sp. CF4.19]|uniref:hypothetical protein n=1 Tax=Aeromicrobium sp. CF4.19 TaxID=3373082 RepID=UPI003EE7EEB9
MSAITRQQLGAAAIAASLLLASACAGEGPNDEGTSPGTDRPSVDGNVMRNGVSHDYDVASSASEVAQNVDLVVSGTVTSWSDGRATREDDLLSRTAILEIAVNEAQGEGSPGPGNAEGDPEPRSIFVEVARGDALVDENGDDLPDPDGYSTQLSVDDLAEAAPVGARVLFMGDPALTDQEIAERWGGVVTQPWQPPVEEAELNRPLLQGLLFEDADGSYVSALAEQTDVQGRGWPDREESGARASENEYEQLLAELF